MRAHRGLCCILANLARAYRHGGCRTGPGQIVTSNLFPILGVSRFWAAGSLRMRIRQARSQPPSSVTSFGEGASMERPLHWPSNPELWLSGIALSPARPWHEYFGVGRLKTGITWNRLLSDGSSVGAFGVVNSEYQRWRTIESLRTEVSGDSRLPLMVLMSAVVFCF